MSVIHTASLVLGVPADANELRESPAWKPEWEMYVQNSDYYDGDREDIIFGIETQAIDEGSISAVSWKEPIEATMNDYLDALEALGITDEPSWFMLNVVH